MCQTPWMCTEFMTLQPPCIRLRAVENSKVICSKKLVCLDRILGFMPVLRRPGAAPCRLPSSSICQYWMLMWIGEAITILRKEHVRPAIQVYFTQINWNSPVLTPLWTLLKKKNWKRVTKSDKIFLIWKAPSIYEGRCAATTGTLRIYDGEDDAYQKMCLYFTSEFPSYL